MDAEDPHRGGIGGRRPHAQQHADPDERTERRGQPAGDSTEQDQPEAQEKDPARAPPVGQLAHRGLRDGARHVERRDEHHALRYAHVESSADRREGGRDHAGVDGVEE
jgi:hypothetical protein